MLGVADVFDSGAAYALAWASVPYGLTDADWRLQRLNKLLIRKGSEIKLHDKLFLEYDYDQTKVHTVE